MTMTMTGGWGCRPVPYIYVYICIYICIYVFVVSMLQPSLLPSGGHFVAPLSRQGNPNAQHVPWEKKQPMG